MYTSMIAAPVVPQLLSKQRSIKKLHVAEIVWPKWTMSVAEIAYMVQMGPKWMWPRLPVTEMVLHPKDSQYEAQSTSCSYGTIQVTIQTNCILHL